MSEREDISGFIEINGKKYVTVQKAQEILTELANELGKPRNYTRFAVFRLATDHKIDIVKTPSANFYNVDDLRNLRDKLQPSRGMPRGLKHFSAEIKEQALLLSQQGLKSSEIARRLGTSYQTVDKWIRKLKQDSMNHPSQ